MIGVYKITNTINNECYIGVSSNINRRFSEHRNNANCNLTKITSKPLYTAINIFGVTNFTFEILELCTLLELKEKEIQYYNVYKPSYCIANPNFQHFGQTPEVRQKISKALKGRKPSEKALNASRKLIGSKNHNAKPVSGIYKDGTRELTFTSRAEAARYLIKANYTHTTERNAASSITGVIKGRRKSYLGFVWS